MVGPNIRAARIRSKLSQEQLGAKAGLSVSYISMLERGERTPPLETLDTLARALAISPVALAREPAHEAPPSLTEKEAAADAHKPAAARAHPVTAPAIGNRRDRRTFPRRANPPGPPSPA
jgi:transcriptional regulator with XRE-family HTH domain